MRKNAFVVVFSSLITGVGGSLFWTVFNLYLWDLNYTLLEISILNIIPTMISIMFSRFFGKWSDVASRKVFIVVGTLISSVSYLFLGFLIINHMLDYSRLIIIFMFFGVSGAISSGALIAVSTTIFERKKSGTSFGTYLSFSAIGWTIGSFLSGVLADLYGIAFISFLTGGFQMLAALLYALFYSEELKRREMRLVDIFRDSWSLKVAGDAKLLFYLYLISSIFALGSSIYNLAFSIKIYIMFESKTYYGYVMGIAGLSNVVSPYLAGRLADKTSKEKLLLGGILARDLYMGYLAIAWDKIATIIFMIAPFWVFIHVPTVAATTDYSKEGHESEIQSLRSIVISISNMLGTLISGLIARIYDVRHNIMAINIVLIIGTIVYFTTLIPAIKLYRIRKMAN